MGNAKESPHVLPEKYATSICVMESCQNYVLFPPNFAAIRGTTKVCTFVYSFALGKSLRGILVNLINCPSYSEDLQLDVLNPGPRELR